MWFWHSTIKSVSQEVLLKQYKPITSLGNLQPSLQNTVQKFVATNPTGEHGPEHTKTCFCGFLPFCSLVTVCCWIALIFKRTVLSQTLDSCELSLENPRVLPSQLCIFCCVAGAQGEKEIFWKMDSIQQYSQVKKATLSSTLNLPRFGSFCLSFGLEERGVMDRQKLTLLERN